MNKAQASLSKADSSVEKDVTKTFDDQDLRKFRGKWNNKKEYTTVKQVRDRFRRMQVSRRTSCPWAAVISETNIATGAAVVSEHGVGTGSNWIDRWNMDYKEWSMWHEYLEGRSNLKSPISFSPVEAAMSEFQDNMVGVTLTPTDENDKEKVKVYEKILEHIHYKGVSNRTNAETFKECLITGTAITYTGWFSRSREVELILGSADVEKELEKDDNKKKVDENKPLTKKKTITEYDDVVDIPVSIYEFFIDPDARCMRGPAYEATDCIWRQTPGIEQFRAEFKDSLDPFVIQENINKVVPAMVAERMYYDGLAFFRAPQDIAQKDKVELLKYYNKSTDEYCIIANDVLIRKGPLPYNHKQLPFSLHRYVTWPHLFYGVGIPVVLESLQAEDETLRNMMLDQMKLNLNPPIFITSDIYSDIDQGWDRIEPGLKIEVGGPVGPDSVRWFEGSQYRPDYFQMRNIIHEDSVAAIGISPLAYAVPKPGEAVRNNVMGLEGTMKMIKKGIKNWADGYRETVMQKIAIVRQFYPDSKVEILNPATGETEEQNRKIRLDGAAIVEETVGDVTRLKEDKINGYSFFELKDDYFDLSGELDVMVDVDSLLPMSQALKVQSIDQALAQLAPLMMNPGATQAPGVVALMREYVETHGLSKKILEQFQNDNSREELQKAEYQEGLIMGGKDASGIPGESNNHVFHHLMTVIDMYDILHNQDKVDPNVVQVMTAALPKMLMHINVDKQLKSDAVGAVTQEMTPPQVPQAPQGALAGPQQPPVPTPVPNGIMNSNGMPGYASGVPNVAANLAGEGMGQMGQQGAIL